MSSEEVVSVQVATAADAVAFAGQLIADRLHPMLLFDAPAQGLHDPFLRQLLASIGHGEYALCLDLSKFRERADLFDLLRRAIPAAANMGSNLNAVAEVLRDAAVAPQRTGRTYWILSWCDNLYELDRPLLVELVQMTLSAARELGDGYFTLTGGFVPPRRLVSVVLTGSWAHLGPEVELEDSFLYRFPSSYEKAFPDLTTRVRSCRIVAKSPS